MRISPPSPVPDGLPLLSAGRHRRPRSGACMMELVSLLAGERWSDAPVCTHPVLGRLARLVNDATSDAERQRLLPLVAPLVGLRPLRAQDADRWGAEIALLAATAALAVAAPWDEAPLAAAVLTCERALGGATLRPASRAAMAGAPDSSVWATDFVDGLDLDHAVVPAGAVVEFAVGSVVASVDNPDAVLRTLLTEVIDRCTALAAQDSAPAAQDPARAVRPQPRPAATTSRTVGATS